MAALNRFLDNVIAQIINPIILLLAAAAFVVFLWGGFQFIRNAGDETKRKEGRSAIFWGLIGLVIIFGAFGIINLALGTFGIAIPNELQRTIP
jgi:TRAP-type C4-dicarboxylate transport system permease small subunit